MSFENIKEEKHELDKAIQNMIIVLTKEIIPLAEMVKFIYRKKGKKKRLRKHSSVKLDLGNLIIVGNYSFISVYPNSYDVIYYKNLVFSFDSDIEWADPQKQKLLYCYHKGDWIEKIFKIYASFKVNELGIDFDITEEDCGYYNINLGICSLHEDKKCFCGDFSLTKDNEVIE